MGKSSVSLVQSPTTATAPPLAFVGKQRRAKPTPTPQPPRAPRLRTIVIRLVTTSASSERLLRSVEGGMDEYTVTSADAAIAVRGRMTIEAVHIAEEAFDQSDIMIDWAESVIRHGNNSMSLSRTELRLLSALLEENGAVVSRAALIGRVWPSGAMPATERENALGVYVCSLRKRLTAIGLGRSLATVRGVGYRISL